MDLIAVDIRSVFFRSDTFPTEMTQVGRLVSGLVSNSIVIAGVIFLFLLLFGGLSIIIGAGQSNPQKAAQRKSAATAALIGFLLIFFAYWIVKAVEIIFGTRIL